MKTILILAGALGAILTANAQTPPNGEGIPKECYAAANASIPKWKLQGKTPAEIEKLFQAALSACSGTDKPMAMLTGTANVDYSRFARMMLNNQMQTNLYLALVRDRSRKLRGARKNPSMAAAYALGDADGDLVGDSKDNCPGTPDLTPTTDEGCPMGGPLPQAPYPQQVANVKNALGILVSPACNGAPIPEMALPKTIGYTQPTHNAYLIRASKVTNQPPNCIVYYEVQVRLEGPIPPGLPEQDGLEMLFRSTENTDSGAVAPPEVLFQVTGASQGSRKRLYDLGDKYRLRWFRIRAVNGNGLTSGWSPYKGMRPLFVVD